MIMRPILLIAVISLAAVAGCSKGEPLKAAAQPAAAQQAAEQKKEGGEAGMCKEHGVLEAICTRCNPKLAAVFQAKGDWCAEHGFPESVCPTCHPERGGKPAVDVASDGAPADGTRVTLKTKDAARLAGIEVVKAVAGRGAAGLVAPAVIAFDAGRVAQVTARAPGVVKRVAVEVGSRVAAGATLAVMESAAVSSDQSRQEAARSRVRMTEANFRRESELEKKGISSKKEVLAAEQEFNQARAELQGVQASLRGVGAGAGGRYVVKAPVSGVVTQRAVSVEGYVEPGAHLFEITDTSSMAAEVALAEADAAKVKTGSTVIIRFDGLGDREFRGTISSIAPAIDPLTRTAKARVRLGNPGGVLRANMYGQARIPVAASPGAAVPQGALQQVESVKLVFVRLAPDEYEARRVEVGASQGNSNMVEVVSGISVGEEVVVAGSFFLKTETLKDSIGAGCCEAGK